MRFGCFGHYNPAIRRMAAFLLMREAALVLAEGKRHDAILRIVARDIEQREQALLPRGRDERRRGAIERETACLEKLRGKLAAPEPKDTRRGTGR